MTDIKADMDHYEILLREHGKVQTAGGSYVYMVLENLVAQGRARIVCAERRPNGIRTYEPM